jgi:hypothetical protein
MSAKDLTIAKASYAEQGARGKDLQKRLGALRSTEAGIAYGPRET